MMGWHDYGWGMTGFGWLFMGLFWLALLGVIIWLVVRLLPGRSTQQQAPPPAVPPAPPAAAPPAPHGSGPGSALDILDRRLAAGEIDVETYRATRAALLEGRGNPQ
ncbi:hypothetical protein Q6348_00520 [Isoptericola sp. b441]|uniref:SHOCT domain-containing protein n=1 Tax=Actinotalea lenta TaxID=3064654 RepID=A0ABT9D4Q0_9CELL|nr:MULTISPECIES: hypothetical protein [unclassified Isoptericola]MDO8105679.1 hypothetical protein [Isoptericola sp. b441]MDO8122384.1 hypothetical protein [Isoptericola sp. b490]